MNCTVRPLRRIGAFKKPLPTRLPGLGTVMRSSADWVKRSDGWVRAPSSHSPERSRRPFSASGAPPTQPDYFEIPLCMPSEEPRDLVPIK